MKWTVTFETVIRDNTGRIVNRTIDENATKKFNTKREAGAFLRSEGFDPYSAEKLPDFLVLRYGNSHMSIVAKITH